VTLSPSYRSARTHPLARLLVATLMALAPAAHAALPSDPAVRAYIQAWQSADGDAVLDAMQENGTYRDSENREAIYGDALARYVAAFRFARLEVLDGANLSDGRVRLDWSLAWPGAQPLRFSEVLSVADGKVVAAVGEAAVPDLAAATPVRRFLEAWAKLDGVALGAQMAPEARLYDHENPAGVDRAAFARISESQRGWRFEFEPPLQAKDGRLTSDYVLHRADGSQSSRRRLFFSLRDGLITRIDSR